MEISNIRKVLVSGHEKRLDNFIHDEKNLPCVICLDNAISFVRENEMGMVDETNFEEKEMMRDVLLRFDVFSISNFLKMDANVLKALQVFPSHSSESFDAGSLSLFDILNKYLK